MNNNIRITEQLLAAYVEGNVSPEERTVVRNYLAQHQEQLESVLFMMDSFEEVPSDMDTASTGNNGLSGEKTGNVSALFPDLSMCAAAFAPPVPKQIKPDCHIADSPDHADTRASFSSRLDSLLED